MNEIQPQQLNINQLRKEATEPIFSKKEGLASPEEFMAKCQEFFLTHEGPVVISKIPKSPQQHSGYLATVNAEGLDITLERDKTLSRLTYNFKSGIIAKNHQPMPDDFNAEFLTQLNEISNDIAQKKATVYSKPPK